MLFLKPGSLFRIDIVTKWDFRLAYVELYVTIGTLFYRFSDLKPNDITDKDIVPFDRFGSAMEDSATLLHVHKAT